MTVYSDDLLDPYVNSVPFVWDFNPAQAVVDTQREDLAAIKRQRELREALQSHIGQLWQAAAEIDGIMDRLNESSQSLHDGAMPDWYEHTAEGVKGLARHVRDDMIYVANRLSSEYLG